MFSVLRGAGFGLASRVLPALVFTHACTSRALYAAPNIRLLSTSPVRLLPTAAARKTPARKSAPKKRTATGKATTKRPTTKRTTTAAGRKKPATKKRAAAKPRSVRRVARKKQRKVALKPAVLPALPPRGGNGYSIFVAEQQLGSVSIAQRAATTSSLWHALTPEQREEYKSRGEALRLQRKKVFDAFVSTLHPHVASAINRARRKKGRGTVHFHLPQDRRRPMTGFLRFFREGQTDGSIDFAGAQSVTEKSKRAGVVWRSMTPAQKEPYQSAYRREFAAYKERIGQA